MLASPLAAAAGCHSPAADDGVTDATLPEPDAARGDAAADGSAPSSRDALAPSPDAGDDIADACGTVVIDGAFIEGTSDGCVSFASLPCGLPPTAELQGCFVDLRTCERPCQNGYFLFCKLAPVSCDDAGDVLDAATIVECISCQGITGRRPLGLVACRPSARNPVGDYFASMAHLESASVRAFVDLAGWLDALGAPARLSRRSRSFADDERRHARAAARLARRFGGAPSPVRVRRVPTPTLARLLEDDAIEGCVKETFGALLATWQAARAGDPRVQRTMRRIAADETRHAALAWEILDWGLPRLPAPERRRVGRALAAAVAALEKREPAPQDPTVRSVAGHPSAEDERRLGRELVRLVTRERPSSDAPFR
jgi:rubrerythrin